MAKTIITQKGVAVNYDNLITIAVEKGEMPNERTGEMEDKIAVIGSDVLGEIIVLGAYESTYAATTLMADITDWLKSDNIPFFEVSQEGGH